jgi:hypothetical protein
MQDFPTKPTVRKKSTGSGFDPVQKSPIKIQNPAVALRRFLYEKRKEKKKERKMKN